MTGQQRGGPLTDEQVPVWPMQLTCGLALLCGWSAAGWHRRRLLAKAERKWGIVALRTRRSAPAPPSGWRPGAAEGWAAPPAESHAWSHGGGSGWVHDGGPHATESSPGPVREPGIYGDGPQHGTRTFADDPGGLYGNGPQHGTTGPADQPGGFYSSDPFGPLRSSGSPASPLSPHTWWPPRTS